MTDHCLTVTINLQKQSLAEVQKSVELKYLELALTETDGNKTHAANIAGITVLTLRRKLERYNVKKVYTLE
ncbi:helix-turn-helix domain-containing protein [Pelagimonas varians]|uniref:Global DNA-binding transcriptional dual regulator Fis n=1 Tax=Pelagimonas varians TaxID=696760 RepID=A0A238KF53_9RHOB|nr:helix-turn-helix domain-containing protein [Pelagimonas varians]PYG32393.1 regulatory Fis family protein [Pelagimonas varians]SMX41483.1 global DNA-binding transcriptional dual regulator Fis [Pelagimonas varians]